MLSKNVEILFYENVEIFLNVGAIALKNTSNFFSKEMLVQLCSKNVGPTFFLKNAIFFNS
jgi:hypothetical protein